MFSKLFEIHFSYTYCSDVFFSTSSIPTKLAYEYRRIARANLKDASGVATHVNAGDDDLNIVFESGRILDCMVSFAAT